MIKVIAKRESGNSLVFFLPDTPARRGYIAYWTPKEGHGEAGIDYFRQTRRPLPSQEAEIARLIEVYAHIGEYTTIKRVQKDSQKLQAYRESMR